MVSTVWYKDKLKDACRNAEGLVPVLKSESQKIAGKANSLSSGFRTQEVTRWETGERVGGTKPQYGYDAKKGRKGPVGIVYTNNYAARKDNLENQTLLKARG